MMALYLMFVVALWVALTWALWRLWRRWRAVEGANRRLRDSLAIVLGALWFGVSFWYGGGRKYYYDWQIERLCAKDGGIKVYETVKLPAEKFDKWGSAQIPRNDMAKPGEEYYYQMDVRYYRQGDPDMYRLSFQIVRRADGKLLGKATSYGRRGGDLPGPWHPSAFGCPSGADITDLKKQVLASTR